MRSKPGLLLPAWLLFGVCACAQAQSLSQCRGQGGATAYRSGDCLPGERLVAVREIEPDPIPATAAPAEAPRAAPPKATKPAYQNRRPARAKRRKSPVDPCTREKRARDDFQRRRSIHVTLDELSRWNHRVYDACK